jgi:hypothetical protein
MCDPLFLMQEASLGVKIGCIYFEYGVTKCSNSGVGLTRNQCTKIFILSTWCIYWQAKRYKRLHISHEMYRNKWTTIVYPSTAVSDYSSGNSIFLWGRDWTLYTIYINFIPQIVN